MAKFERVDAVWPGKTVRVVGRNSTLASAEVERTHLQLHSSCTANGHPGVAARLLVGHGGGNQLLFARRPKHTKTKSSWKCNLLGFQEGP